MTALGKFFRTTTFKLTLVYLTVFALFAAFLLGYFAWNTRRLITEQITETVDAEIAGLAEQYRRAASAVWSSSIESRAARPGSSLYLVTTPAGEALAGNVGSLPPGLLESRGWTETEYRRLDEPEGAEHHALVRVFQLPGGFRLLVGRDLDERERLYDIVLPPGNWSVAIVVVLGLAGGFFVTRRVLRRVDAMTETTRTIMEGDLGGRLPVAGTGDELDRLADNLNAMLERIEALMHGLKEVSDNIAHDLKTPLTRLRNRAEEALRTAKSEAEYRAALEATIEESDGLIRTFNALLMIARAESGQARDNMSGIRRRRGRARHRRTVRAAGGGKGARPEGRSGRIRCRCAATANWSARRCPTWSITPSSMRRLAEGGVGAGITVRRERWRACVSRGLSTTGPALPKPTAGAWWSASCGSIRAAREPGSGLGLSLVAAVARLHGGELRLEDNEPGLKAVMVLPRATCRVAVPRRCREDRTGIDCAGLGQLTASESTDSLLPGEGFRCEADDASHRPAGQTLRNRARAPHRQRPGLLRRRGGCALRRMARGARRNARPATRSRRFLRQSPESRALIAGLAGHSPYLWDLASADPERLVALLRSDPDRDFLARLRQRPSRSRPARMRPKPCGCCAG